MTFTSIKSFFYIFLTCFEELESTSGGESVIASCEDTNFGCPMLPGMWHCFVAQCDDISCVRYVFYTPNLLHSLDKILDLYTPKSFLGYTFLLHKKSDTQTVSCT